MQIDHVIYATADLDAAAERLEAELGLPVVPGGRHTGIGTHNRIVPLGGGYLEILAVADREEAEASDIGRALLGRIAEGDGLFGWAVTVPDAAAAADRLGLELTSIEREGLFARLAGVTEAMREPFLPFFIEREDGLAPSVGEGGGVTWVEVAGDGERLEQWLGGADLPLRLVDGQPRVRGVGIGARELRA